MGFVEDGFYDNIAEVRADPQYANVSQADAEAMIGEIKYRDYTATEPSPTPTSA